MGGISNVGMVVKDPQARKVLSSKGILLYTSSAAIAGLDYQIRNNISQMVLLFYSLDIKVTLFQASANFNLDKKLTSPWGYCTIGLLVNNSFNESIVFSYHL